MIDAFPENRIDTYVLFSKLGEFTDQEVKMCMAAQGDFRKRVILLTDRELEDRHIYEQANEEFQIVQGAVTLEVMALNTEAIFLNKIKK